MLKLSGKIAVVTGGTGSLGRVVVKRLLEEGVVVITTHTGNQRSIEFVKETQRQFPCFHGKELDVTSEADVRKFFQWISDTFKRIDILIHLVGGVNPKKFIEDISVAEWNKMFTLNLFSTFLLIRSSVGMMKQHQWGRIVTIAAMPAITPEAKRGGYGVAKAGVVTLTKTVAEEIKEYGDITVNAIAPSTILTEDNKLWGTPDDSKKLVTPEEIAETILHLTSPEARAINGQVIQMYGKV